MNKLNLKYIAEKFCKQMAYVLLVSIFMVFWIWLIDGDSSLLERFEQYPMFLLLMLTVSLIGFGMNSFSIQLHNLVAYGATRKNALQTILIIEGLVLFCGFIIILAFSGVNTALLYLPNLVFAMGVGIIFGLLVATIGKAGYYIFVVCCCIMGGVMGYFMVSMTFNAVMPGYKIELILASALFLAACIFISRVLTRKITVNM